jgi:hypothetical protein
VAATATKRQQGRQRLRWRRCRACLGTGCAAAGWAALLSFVHSTTLNRLRKTTEFPRRHQARALAQMRPGGRRATSADDRRLPRPPRDGAASCDPHTVSRRRSFLTSYLMERVDGPRSRRRGRCRRSSLVERRCARRAAASIGWAARRVGLHGELCRIGLSAGARVSSLRGRFRRRRRSRARARLALQRVRTGHRRHL